MDVRTEVSRRWRHIARCLVAITVITYITYVIT